MTAIAKQDAAPSAMVLALAERYGVDPVKFSQTVQSTIMPEKATREQTIAFLMVCRQYDLNPFLKQIYPIPNRNGVILPMVPVDGWAKLANDNPAFNGAVFEDKHDDKGNLLSITCKMYRKDRQHPIEATEYLKECMGASEPWKKFPHRMLRHKAFIQAARLAFSFSGIYDPDEVARHGGSSPDAPKTTQQRLEATIEETGKHLPVPETLTGVPVDAEGQESLAFDGDLPEADDLGV
jgi:hypothetical protein